MCIIGLLSENWGTDNQIKGLLEKYYELQQRQNSAKNLLKSLDGVILHPKNFRHFIEFKKAVYDSIDEFLKNCQEPPLCALLPLNHGLLQQGENKDVDDLALVVKEAFLRHNIQIKTFVLASNLYNYQHIDIIHVCNHLLTENDEIALANDNALREKVIITVGVPSNISKEKIESLATAPLMARVLAKYHNKKTILFCVGGITEDKAIAFSIQDALCLLNAAQEYQKCGYEVVFVNSPRTPSEVTDFLYEACLNKNMAFFNAKKIAANKAEEQNFRFYNGSYKQEFTKQAQEIGNIYPAILKVCTKVVYTWDSFSYTSDAAVIGITTLVYTGNKINQERQDCHKLYKTCRRNSFILDLDEDMCFAKKGYLIETLPVEDVSTQIVKEIIKRCR